jgi:hypothetical protein
MSNNNSTNTGNWNTGNRNTGNWNTGDYNTGNWNTGNRNTGDWNTGNRNTGNWNTGNWNTGHWNTGYCNTGNWNNCNYSTGFFNTQEQPLYMFNKLVEGVSRNDIDTYLAIPLTEWILPEDMTDQEKSDNPSWETCEGFLKERTFDEACKVAWEKADQKTKDKFLNLPNFDPEIFKEITGIDVTVKEETINIDGVEYTLSEIKKALKK